MNYVEFVDEEGEKTYFINTKKRNIFETMRGLFFIIFTPSCLLRNYVVKNEKMAKLLVRTLLVIGIVLAIFAIRAIIKITIPPPAL